MHSQCGMVEKEVGMSRGNVPLPNSVTKHFKKHI